MSQQLEQMLALNHGEKPECENVDEPQRTLVLFQLAGKILPSMGRKLKRSLLSARSPGFPVVRQCLKGSSTIVDGWNR